MRRHRPGTGPRRGREVKRALLLVDHGSRRAEANALIEEVARQLRDRKPDWVIETAHMELATPDIAEGLESCVRQGANEIVVHPYFLGPGNHTARDIPRLVEEAMHQHPGIGFRITPPLGVHPGIVDVVLERVGEDRSGGL